VHHDDPCSDRPQDAFAASGCARSHTSLLARRTSTLSNRERDGIEQQRIPGFRSVWLYVIGVSIAANLWGALHASANRLRSSKRARFRNALRGTRAGTGLYLINVTDTHERLKARGRGGEELVAFGGIGFSRSYFLRDSGDSGICAISNGERTTLLARYLKRVSRRKKKRERERELSHVMQACACFSSALRRLNLTSMM